MFQIKRIIASFMCAVGFTLVLFLGIIVLNPRMMLDSKEIIFSFAVIIGLFAISAFLYRSTISVPTKRRQVMYALGCTLLILYGGLLIGLLFFNNRRQMAIPNFNDVMLHLNLVPLKTIKSYLRAYESHTIAVHIVVENIIGNLVLFFPMGLILPTLMKRFRNSVVFASFMIAVLFFVESMQLFTGTGTFDIDDIILNFIGASVAYALWHFPFIQKIRKHYLA